MAYTADGNSFGSTDSFAGDSFAGDSFGSAGPTPHVQYRSPSGEPVVDITPIETFAPAPPAPYVLIPRNGRGTAALWFGCLAVVCTGGLFVLFPLGVLFALLAIFLGRAGRDRASWGGATNRASATAGLTLGIVGLVLGGALTAGTVWVTQKYDVGAIRDCVQDRSSAAGAGHCLIDVFDHAKDTDVE